MSENSHWKTLAVRQQGKAEQGVGRSYGAEKEIKGILGESVSAADDSAPSTLHPSINSWIVILWIKLRANREPRDEEQKTA